MRGPGAILIALGLAVAVPSCIKDPTLDEGPVPTPYHIDLPQWVLDSIGPMPVPAGNPLTVEGVALGRRLFHETALSDDGSMACATCHVQANGFSDPRPFSLGTDGSVGTRNAMAIINLAWSEQLFWDGRRHTLEDQAHDPVTNPIEMRNTWPVVVARLQADPGYRDLFKRAFGSDEIDSLAVVKAIAQFERTMVSFGSRFDRYYYQGDTNVFSPAEKRGFKIFGGKGRCARCHVFGLFTDDHLRNNGLDAVITDPGLAGITGLASDQGKFKVTTLRNIAATAPYMHDSPFGELQDITSFYNTHVQFDPVLLDTILYPAALHPGYFNGAELLDLEAFLRTLTDSTFLTDPAFGPP